MHSLCSRLAKFDIEYPSFDLLYMRCHRSTHPTKRVPVFQPSYQILLHIDALITGDYRQRPCSCTDAVPVELPSHTEHATPCAKRARLAVVQMKNRLIYTEVAVISHTLGLSYQRWDPPPRYLSARAHTPDFLSSSDWI